MATFFENLGWKVFRVPETATVLMSGGIAFGELNEEQIFDFQVIKIKISKIGKKTQNSHGYWRGPCYFLYLTFLLFFRRI